MLLRVLLNLSFPQKQTVIEDMKANGYFGGDPESISKGLRE